jgi:AcrR family transcriptional regulator
VSWAERAADRSPSVQRSRERTMTQARVIVEAARRLVHARGEDFTTQELAREAGVALQTFYRHFPGKDQLLAAVIEEEIADAAARLAAAASDLPDPLARLRSYVESVLSAVTSHRESDAFGPRFMTAQHWRLRQRLPEDMARAVQPMTDLFARELREAEAAGLLRPTDVDRDAALITKLLMAVYHDHAYAAPGEPADGLIEHVWAFCLGGVGARAAVPATSRAAG